MSKIKAELIKYSKKLNITNLSALRSGNISVRTKEKGVDGGVRKEAGCPFNGVSFAFSFFG